MLTEKNNLKTAQTKQGETQLCRRCNRPLLDAVSRAFGLGRTCRLKTGISKQRTSPKLKKFLEFTFLEIKL